MSRQYFADISVDPPIANLSSIVATTITALWNAANYTPIPANDARPGKIYRVIAGGIMSFGATGTLTISPFYGLTTAGVAMGASIAQTSPGTTTNQPWRLEMDCICRTIGATGSATSTVIGTGKFITAGLGSAGTGVSMAFGGTSATVDTSAASGITIGWTLTVAGTVTPQYVFMQTLN